MEIKKISYTGSLAVGRKVQVAAATSNLKRVVLELGGKAASIIFSKSVKFGISAKIWTEGKTDDADLENALTQSSQNFLINSGQFCVAALRILVHEDIADRFVEELKTRFEMFAVAMGDQMTEQTFLGPVADKTQTGRILSFFAQAKKDNVEF